MKSDYNSNVDRILDICQSLHTPSIVAINIQKQWYVKNYAAITS